MKGCKWHPRALPCALQNCHAPLLQNLMLVLPDLQRPLELLMLRGELSPTCYSFPQTKKQRKEEKQLLFYLLDVQTCWRLPTAGSQQDWFGRILGNNWQTPWKREHRRDRIDDVSMHSPHFSPASSLEPFSRWIWDGPLCTPLPHAPSHFTNESTYPSLSLHFPSC